MNKRVVLNKLRFFVALLFATCFIVTGCGGEGAGGDLREFSVNNVVDGDTIEISNGRKVRYLGIDTPETMKRTSGGNWTFDPEEFAVEAKEYNRSLVKGKKVTLEFDTVTEDKYGRWLAYVYVDDKMANAELVRKGYAMVYTFPPNVKHVGMLMEVQEDARRSGRGLWGTLKNISPNAADDYIGQYGVVRGLIVDVHVAPRMIFLNFGRDRQKDLTAVIYSSNITLFERRKIDPAAYYRGKNVEIVGKIKYRNGPRMVIDNPSQIKVIGIL